MKKRALVLRGGTMRGAFITGAMKIIDGQLGPNYFDTIFSISAGIFEQAFFAARQVEIMENSWKNYVHGKQLINFWNIFKNKGIIDLDYVVGLIQTDKSYLDLEMLKKSPIKLLTFVADYETREPEIMEIKNKNIFDIMRAACALPYLYNKKVIINDKRYVDSWTAPKNKFNKLLLESLKDYDEVLVIQSKNRNDKRLEGIKNILKPSKSFLWGALDTNRDCIIKTIKQGEIDMAKYIAKNNLKRDTI